MIAKLFDQDVSIVVLFSSLEIWFSGALDIDCNFNSSYKTHNTRILFFHDGNRCFPCLQFAKCQWSFPQ